MSLRAVPWLLALGGLAIPLVGSGFVLLPIVAIWLAVLALIWRLGSRMQPLPRAGRITLAAALLPLLFLMAYEGGWWLIPGDLAWLFIALADSRRATP